MAQRQTWTNPCVGQWELTNPIVEQALFGYSDGHRLLTSSLVLDQAASRLLRSATDMTFDSDANYYSTLLPVPTMSLFAFIRTWPAPDWERPGSVWSHVFLVDYVALGRIQDFNIIRDAFRRPKPDRKGGVQAELPHYSERAELGEVSPKRLNDDIGILHGVLDALYSSGAPVVLGLRGADRHEPLLYALLAQQWPRLRRDFSSRTRARSSDSSWRVDLEIVDKGASSGVPNRDSPWVDFLVEDLLHPSTSLRAFLQRYGAESSAGRPDMSKLASIYALMKQEQPAATVRQLRSEFPTPKEMSTLKKDLFGRAGNSVDLSWPLAEPDRLHLAFAAGDSVDFSALDIGARMLSLVGEARAGARLRDLSLEHLSPPQAESLVADIASHSDIDTAARLAAATPDLGVLIASRTPAIIQRVSTWDSLDRDLLTEITLQLSVQERDRIVDSLVEAGGSEPLSMICERDRNAWWRAVLHAGSHAKSSSELLTTSSTLRRVLDRVGGASLDFEDNGGQRSPGQMVSILMSADLASGLWRRYDFKDWSRLLAMIDHPGAVQSLPTHAKDRIYAVTLLTAAASGESTSRKSGWRATFAHLHRRLEDPKFDGEAWSVLASALPTGPDWDRCYRLRHGVAAEIRRDRWTVGEIEVLVADAGPGTTELLSLTKPAAPKKRQGVLQDILDFFFS